MKKGFHLTFNAPVTLVFAAFSAFILFLDMPFLLKGKLIPALFMVPGNAHAQVPFEWNSFISYIRLFTHVLGHTDWSHFLSNFAFILILGPIMEEKYGSVMLSLMMVITALITGLVNALCLTSSLTGASGIAFMLIVLTSISTIYKNELPVSFIGVLIVFIAREFIAPSGSNISTIAHLAGGLCGSLFGFLIVPKDSKTEKITVSKPKRESKKASVQDREARLKEIDADSPRNKTEKKSYDDDETIEIGTIKL